jgi:hypothetical protein
MMGPSVGSREPKFDDLAAVVGTSHRMPKRTLRSVEPVLRSTGVRITAIVVDNASGDGSAELVQSIRRDLAAHLAGTGAGDTAAREMPYA